MQKKHKTAINNKITILKFGGVFAVKHPTSIYYETSDKNVNE